MKNPFKSFINYHRVRFENDKQIADKATSKNPYLFLAIVLELIYVATGSLSPIRENFGDGVTAVAAVLWHALAVVLLLLGVIYLFPAGRRFLKRDHKDEQQ